MNGLTQDEVQERIRQGQVNVDRTSSTKSYRAIILGNLMTYFNLLNVIFFVAIIMVGSFKNGLFMIVIVVNTAIGIFQEVRTKKTLDKLTILNMSDVKVLRDGSEQEIKVTEIVMDDILVLKSGDQIPCDSVVAEGFCEVNESLLTGESDNVHKREGDVLLSGSFITAGSCRAKVEKVGKDSYAARITGEARNYRQSRSELKKALNRLLKFVAFAIIPLCVLLFGRLYFSNGYVLRDTVEQVVAAGVGMIPEGLMLLTSVSLTLGVLKLAQENTIVQDLYCIETLARVDVLCLDKTGTLTEGRLKVEEVIPFCETADLETAMRELLFTEEQKNATTEALSAHFGSPINTAWQLKTRIPFSSEWAFSAAEFEEHGTIYIGAVQALFPDNAELRQEAAEYASQGYRVIVSARSTEPFTGPSVPADIEPLGLILLSDVIRTDCQKTLEYFAAEGVSLKVISGDDPVTVSRIAEQCGLEGYDRYLDASRIDPADLPELMEEYNVFGRVRPELKKEMVAALQRRGHTVAMTGDGVNDVLAFKQADCSVAMASGSDAAKHTADIVLLNSDFSSLPDVLKQGRRVINNICKASSMYLIKTMFSIVMTLLTIIAGTRYPIQSVHMSIISAFAVGMPTFLLQFEPNYDRVEDNFVKDVMHYALPAGLTIAILSFSLNSLGLLLDPTGTDMVTTMCVFVISSVYFYMLRRVYAPMTPYRRIVIYTLHGLFFLTIVFGQGMLDMTDVTTTGVVALVAAITFAPVLEELSEHGFDYMLDYLEKRNIAKELRRRQQII